MGKSLNVKKGFSNNTDPVAAVADIKQQVDQEGLAGVLFFSTSKTDLEKVGKALGSSFDCPIIGCTTSGELSPLGYPDGSFSAAGIAGEGITISTYLLENLKEFDIGRANSLANRIKAEYAEKRKDDPDIKAFGILLIDGLSMAEEGVIGHLHGALENIPIVGGSAGDDLKFKETYVYHNGKFLSSSAVFAVFYTSIPFTTFKTQHFVPGDEKMVITAAIPELRIVTEINGLPAAQEYARFVGLEVDKLEPMTFSKYPVMLKIGGDYYVRSIQKVNSDQSLTFYCAIDEGLVLTLAKGVDLIENLKKNFENVRKTIPQPKMIIGCECILRRLEILEKGLQKESAALMNENNVVGFHTYGEQFNSVHVNQTFTGVAIG